MQDTSEEGGNAKEIHRKESRSEKEYKEGPKKLYRQFVLSS